MFLAISSTWNTFFFSSTNQLMLVNFIVGIDFWCLLLMRPDRLWFDISILFSHCILSCSFLLLFISSEFRYIFIVCFFLPGCSCGWWVSCGCFCCFSLIFINNCRILSETLKYDLPPCSFSFTYKLDINVQRSTCLKVWICWIHSDARHCVSGCLQELCS